MVEFASGVKGIALNLENENNDLENIGNPVFRIIFIAQRYWSSEDSPIPHGFFRDL
nr:hypothetical protein SETIT_9G334000v2 [Ipomoea batatas]GMC61269.1 hypothetical protein SETIT_9G334000v2 [Ipomoea batatas]GMD25715.1 hypothetical protein SETIT_9G334000v2 [Ipomoea batatas]